MELLQRVNDLELLKRIQPLGTEQSKLWSQKMETIQLEKNNWLSEIDKIIYINLDRRTDRLLSLQKEFERLQIPISKLERFSAVEHWAGCYGCTLSHVAVLKRAIERNYENVWIVEDDIEFQERQLVQNNIQQFFKAYGKTYSIANVVAQVQKLGANTGVVSKVVEVCSTASYIINRRFMKTLLNCFLESAPLLLKTEQHWLYSLDQYWKRLQQQKNIEWYIFTPQLGKQSQSLPDTNIKRPFKYHMATFDTLLNKTKTQPTLELLEELVPFKNHYTFDAAFWLELAKQALEKKKTKLARLAIDHLLDIPSMEVPAFLCLKDASIPLSTLPNSSCRTLPYKAKPNLCGGNVCIMPLKDRYICIVRQSNWVRKRCLDPRGILRNENIVLVLDKDLNIVKQYWLVDQEQRERNVSGWTGFEDIRLYEVCEDVIKFTCSNFEKDGGLDGRPQIARVVARFENEEWRVQSVVHLPRIAYSGEKNWLVFKRSQTDDFYTVIYHWYPYYHVLRLDMDNVSTHYETIFRRLPTKVGQRLYEGSCVPIWYKKRSCWLSMVHISTHQIRGEGRFYHRFVTLDSKNLDIVEQSDIFHFQTDGVEYSCGMCWSHDDKNLIITFAHEDTVPYILRIDIDDLESLFHNNDRQDNLLHDLSDTASTVCAVQVKTWTHEIEKHIDQFMKCHSDKPLYVIHDISGQKPVTKIPERYQVFTVQTGLINSYSRQKQIKTLFYEDILLKKHPRFDSLWWLIHPNVVKYSKTFLASLNDSWIERLPCSKHDIWPLPYSMPSEKIMDNAKKTTIVAELRPTFGANYRFKAGEEKAYYQMYNEAYFAHTKAKGGWDCLRHYEILAAGCIPIFDRLEQCPAASLVSYPKALVLEAKNKLWPFDETKEKIALYQDYLTKLTQYTKTYLTCEYVAEYFLSKLLSQPQKILLLTCDEGINYSRETLTIGLRRKLGSDFVDYPKIEALYKSCPNPGSFYGNGFTYSHTLEDNVKIDRTKIEDRIRKKEFDVIVYGKTGPHDNSLPNLPFWNTVKTNYQRDQIVFVYGGDAQMSLQSNNPFRNHLLYHHQFGKCFVRELVI